MGGVVCVLADAVPGVDLDCAEVLLMALAFSNLGASANPDINSGTDAASYANTSWTPPTSGLIKVAVWSREAAGPNQPTISGNNLTWTAIATVVASTVHRLTLFGANASGSSAGVT